MSSVENDKLTSTYPAINQSHKEVRRLSINQINLNNLTSSHPALRGTNSTGISPLKM